MPVMVRTEELIYALLKAFLLYNLEREAGRIYSVFVEVYWPPVSAFLFGCFRMGTKSQMD